MSAAPGSIDPEIAGEAASWLVRLHSGRFSEADRQACERWRQRSAEHDLAWTRAQAVLAKLGGLPSGLGRATVDATASRRTGLRVLAGLIVATPAGWLAWRAAPRQWTADYATRSGERRRIELPDGSLLVLNTASAVDLDYTGEQRLLRLVAGEILLRSAHSRPPDPRPLLVRTAEGSVQPLGTYFAVRQMEARSRVTVIEGRVRVQPRAALAGVVLEAGQSTDFSAEAAQPAAASTHPPQAWLDGVLYADNLRLADFLQELARYRPGLLRCDPEVADLRISGGFQVDDTDAVLLAVSRALPVRVVYRTRYWVSVTAS
ncbi:FecR domain-containing protein [Achromobacter deleyi]|uniref:FecR domain-containing protein n=1 Tax=Achromobacter deleyi TaxID=1353891 RepID=UPI0014915492|nr:FecR family protein [Achromobacter deleyi]QVQ26934.1 FecR family protein [Achromobacter deleyi]UIP22509.1 FecR family protein [Achromobacter deleyi]